MAERVAVGAESDGEKTVKPAKRLCNEIQLFDLCELEKCGHKQGLFCTNTELLNRFEAIAEEDERPAAALISDELDEGEATDDEDDDVLDDEDFDDEGYEEDE